MLRRLNSILLITALTLAAGTALADEPATENAAKAAAPRWIGVVCHPLSATLRAHLSVPENQGLVVARVVPNGPAAKAGLQEHDILLTADEQPLRTARDLSQSVADGGQSVALVVLRRGDRKTLNISPNARPAQPPVAVAVGGPEREALREWVEQLEQLVPQGADEAGRPNRRFRFRFLHPGAILGGGDLAANFPKDLSITINREGEDPLKITVEKDGEKWELNRGELGKLPQNLLPLVERMLGDTNIPALPEGDIDLGLPEIGLPNVALPGVDAPAADNPVTPPAPVSPPAAAPNDGVQRLEKQLQALQQRLEAMQKQLDAGQEASDE